VVEQARYEELEKENKELRDELAARIKLSNILADSVTDVVYILDPDSKIIEVNNKVEDYGYTAAELRGRPFSDFVPDEYKDLARQIAIERREKLMEIKEGVRKQYSQTVELPFLVRSNKIKEVQVSGGSFVSDFSVETIRIHKGERIKRNHVYTIGVARDISKQKDLERDFRDQINTNKELIEGLDKAGINVDIVSTDYQVLYQTPGLKEVFGDSAGKDCFEHYMNRDTPCEHCALVKAVETGTIQSVELQGKDENYYQIISVPHTGPDGETDRVIEIIQSMTEQKNREKELTESHALMRNILDNSPGAIFLKDKDGAYMAVNRSYEEIVGKKEDQVIGKTDYELFPEENAANFRANDQKVMQQGKAITVDELAEHHDGSTHDYLSVKFPLIDAQDQIYGSGGVSIDITEQKETNDRLRESEEKYRNLVERANEGISILQDGEIKFTNRLMCELFGYTREEMLNTSFLNYIHEDDQSEIVELYQRRLKGEEMDKYYTIKGINKNGDVIDVETNSGMITYEGKSAMMVFSRDIRERVKNEEEKAKLEAQLHQAQKMEAIGTLAGGFAHDFNNVLTPIFSCSQLLEKRLSDADDRILTLIGYIRKSVQRATDLVSQILNFSRRYDSKKEITDTTSIIKETITLLRSALPSTIDLQSLFEAESTNVLCDPTQIHQVLMNLGTNAGHAMKENGGTLEIAVSNFKEYEGNFSIRKGNYLLMTVRDTGIGMSQETKQRIFEPFFTTKNIGEGSGLGLSVTYGIIDSLNGYIHAYSELGKGTKFHVYLPVVEGEVASESKTDEDIPTGNETIMIVDDEEFNVFSYSALLENQGYKAVGFTDSRKAYEAFQNNPDRYDLIFTDYTMPNYTGLMLAEKVREINDRTPVVLISGLSEAVSEQEIKKAGIKKVLSKPIDLYDLAVAIRSALDE